MGEQSDLKSRKLLVNVHAITPDSTIIQNQGYNTT